MTPVDSSITETEARQHFDDTARHVAPEDRKNWNDKADKAYVDHAIKNAIQDAIDDTWAAGY